MLALQPPVPGPIVRPFHYAGSPFARGLHRGVDLSAPPGTAVRAPCAGRVAWAGPSGVTIRCGRERVTLLPLTRVVARPAEAVGPGDDVGRVQGGDGLHLGVRHAGDPFGYVDPAPLLRRPGPGSPPLTGPGPRSGRRPVTLRPRAIPARARAPSAEPVAPWPAWAGLALVLGAVRWRARRDRRRLGAAKSARVRAGPPQRVS